VILGTGSDRDDPERSFSAATFFNVAKPERSSISLSSPLFLFIVSLRLSSELLLFVSSADTSESISS